MVLGLLALAQPTLAIVITADKARSLDIAFISITSSRHLLVQWMYRGPSPRFREEMIE
jgi:hypothetical protein